MSELPQSVFDAAVLRGLEPRARDEIAAAGALRALEEGARVYEAGAAGDAFFVVARGAVALSAVRRGDDGATPLRVARAGESFGEEATVGLVRRATAVALEPSLVAEVPVHLFRRAAARSGRADGAERMERALLRAATRDLLATAAFARDLPERDLEMLLDAARARRLERGDAVYRQGDGSTEFYLLGDGMVQIQTEDAGRVHVRAYVTRGDFFGDAEIASGSPRQTGAVAMGKTLLFAVPAKVLQTLADRNPTLLPRLRRVAVDQEASQRMVAARAANSTQHVLRDLYRLDAARSLLVIDLDACVRCGQCAWACAEVHGVARLVRRGDKIVTRHDLHSEPLSLDSSLANRAIAPSTLLLPNSCQHCENPACMPECPTGAIGRDPGGEVFIRDALCTGCGACAKGCPWDNIQMAPRPAGTHGPLAPRPGATDDVAVKCDLCRGYEGPACVMSCPTSAIVRIDPAEALSDVRDLLAPGRAPRGASAARATTARHDGRPLVLGAAIAGIAVGLVGVLLRARGALAPGRGLGLAAGVLAALGFAALLAYAVPKRGVRWLHRKRDARADPLEARAPAISKLAPQLSAHVAIGLVATGLVAAHARLANAIALTTIAGALTLAFVAASLSGALLYLFYGTLPRRLTRLERAAALPEDRAGHRRALLDHLYREATGKSDLVKKILERILLPYATRPLGWLALLASGRSLSAEQRRVRARVDATLEGRGGERLGGVDDLVRLVVELRAAPAQRLLERGLRGLLPVHVVAFAVAAALLVVHVFAVSRRP